ncbi:unnamed protein product [Hyaloperonospora brassicae]|uniref:Vacuolar ATPase assembly protein VMA22 n=1 Tax=Hyaloperonospora brassicae TaxID=162125 RepID=A0AAV0ULV1_HYABA|nr:unnamed protein product [Hyaloperonospora brassicae]
MAVDAVDADNALVEGIASLEQYLDDQERSCNQLKKGFLLLTKARMLLPPHTLSEISYHEESEASIVVTVDWDGKWRLQDASEAKRQKVDEKRRGATLVHRRKAGPSNEEAKRDGAESSKSTGVDSDTLLWFSSLPPSDLREAKKQFSSGLQALLVAAASAQQVQKAVRDVATKSNELYE